MGQVRLKKRWYTPTLNRMKRTHQILWYSDDDNNQIHLIVETPSNAVHKFLPILEAVAFWYKFTKEHGDGRR